MITLQIFKENEKYYIQVIYKIICGQLFQEIMVDFNFIDFDYDLENRVSMLFIFG